MKEKHSSITVNEELFHSGVAGVKIYQMDLVVVDDPEHIKKPINRFTFDKLPNMAKGVAVNNADKGEQVLFVYWKDIYKPWFIIN